MQNIRKLTHEKRKEPNLCNHKESLSELLQKRVKMFDETLGKCTDSDYTIELKEDSKPYHAKPLPISKIRGPTLKK